MFITIDSYPEFESDVKKTWNSVINEHHFQVNSPREGIVMLVNQKTKLTLILGADERVGFVIENCKTKVVYDELSLYMFTNLSFTRSIAGTPSYPITEDHWRTLVSKREFRKICLIDLPIVRDEISSNWPYLLSGDFRKEHEFLEWKAWTDKPGNRTKSMKELSYGNYLDQMRKF